VVVYAAALSLLGAVSQKPVEVVVISAGLDAKSPITASDVSSALKAVRPTIVAVMQPVDAMQYQWSSRRRIYGRNLNALDGGVNDFLRSSAGDNVVMRPYDIKGGTAFLQSAETQRKMAEIMREVTIAKRDNLLTLDSKMALTRAERFREIMGAYADDDFLSINRDSTDAVYEMSLSNYYASMGEVLKETPSLSRYSGFWRKVGGFQRERNRQMAYNLKELVKDNPGARIAVLTTPEHAYYLRSHLKGVSAELGAKVQTVDDYRPSTERLGG